MGDNDGTLSWNRKHILLHTRRNGIIYSKFPPCWFSTYDGRNVRTKSKDLGSGLLLLSHLLIEGTDRIFI